MYSHYLYDDRNENQFLDVTEPTPEAQATSSMPEEAAKPTLSQNNNVLKSLFGRFKFDNNTLLPLLILAFLLFDADDDERLIIIALALFIGL